MGEIKERITKDYEAVVLRQSLTITNLQEASDALRNDKYILESDKEELAKKNYSQSCVLARLNAERDKMIKELKTKDQSITERDQRILALQAENHDLKIKGASGRMEEMVTEMWSIIKKQRPPQEH